jgi:hypothetical protein
MEHVRDILIGLAPLVGILLGPAMVSAQDRPQPATAPVGEFVPPAAWELSAPLIGPEKRSQDPSVSVKDPSIVFHEGRWHVFMTIRCEGWTPIEYASFDKWENADKAPRTILRVREKYYCAPQVFYFRPQKKWYLIYQVGDPNTKLKHQVAYSTSDNVAEPNSWTKTQYLMPEDDPRKEAGLDYWIICDEQRAYLFYTSLNGKMWRLWTKLEDFPKGFGHCELALQADIFEASHTYRLKGMNKYLTVVEANPGWPRYYKAYLADRLEGQWKPIADTQAKPFAGAANVRPASGGELWTDNISHGELIREGIDETMTVDPRNLRFVIQGALEKDRAGKPYGKIPWRIGILTPAKGT